METTLKPKWKLHLSDSVKSIIIDIIVYLFIILFVYTATSKIQTFHSFKIVLSRSVLIGHFSNIVAWGTPAIELLISLVLLIPQHRKVGLIGCFLLMIIFTSYLLYMINSGSTLTCTCGGVISSMSWRQHIWFNTIFIALSGIGLFLENSIKVWK